MPIIISFAGHLGNDPELRHTPNKNIAVTEAAVYVNRRTKQGQEWVDAEATRYAIKAWRRHAETLATLEKGAGVLVIGHVETESWIDPETEEKRYRDTVVVDELGHTFG